MSTQSVEIKSHYTTLQDVFDRIWFCFAIQKNNLAKNGMSECSYDAMPNKDNRCGCAIGCLFQEYQRPRLVGSVKNAIRDKNLNFAPILHHNASVMEELQMRHDSSTTRAGFVIKLRDFALRYKLVIPKE